MASRRSYFIAHRADKVSKFFGHVGMKDCGTVDITTDAAGDGTSAVSFNREFKKTPVVFLLAQQADITGTLCATGISTSGFTAQVDGSSVVSGTLRVGWVAFEPV